jgi:hypothetical protein
VYSCFFSVSGCVFASFCCWFFPLLTPSAAVCYQLAVVCFLVVTACHLALLVRDFQYIYMLIQKKIYGVRHTMSSFLSKKILIYAYVFVLCMND